MLREARPIESVLCMYEELGVTEGLLHVTLCLHSTAFC